MADMTPKGLSLAICLSGLAGAVDAIGYLQLGGYFLSFMSGNSTQFAIDLATGQFSPLMKLGGIIVLFVMGATFGTLIGDYVSPAKHLFKVQVFVSCLLLAAALSAELGWQASEVALLTLSMGAENAAMRRAGQGAISLTFISGTLVKMGQNIALALTGGAKLAWLPDFLLWVGLVSGGLLGAVLYYKMGLTSLWLIALISLGLTLVIYWRNPLADGETKK